MMIQNISYKRTKDYQSHHRNTQHTHSTRVLVVCCVLLCVPQSNAWINRMTIKYIITIIYQKLTKDWDKKIELVYGGLNKTWRPCVCNGDGNKWPSLHYKTESEMCRNSKHEILFFFQMTCMAVHFTFLAVVLHSQILHLKALRRDG